MPVILDNLSIKIKSGQYIAIVGQTGCRKSTLMRLLLGFEAPAKGVVYYDGKDLTTVDLKSIRRNIGVVMQNGKLMQGDIYSNIVIAAPWLMIARTAFPPSSRATGLSCSKKVKSPRTESMRSWMLKMAISMS